MYVLIEDGVIVQDSLPLSGYLKDGRSISGYSMLPEEVLLGEGWLQAERVMPEYDPATQRLVVDSVETTGNKAVITYRAMDILVG